MNELIIMKSFCVNQKKNERERELSLRNIIISVLFSKYELFLSFKLISNYLLSYYRYICSCFFYIDLQATEC